MQAPVRRVEPEPAFNEMIDRFSALLDQGAPTPSPRPAPDARSTVLRIARQVINQIESGRAEEMLRIAPDLSVYALTPYVGYTEAKRCSQSAADVPPSA
jgi:hypothetical protein